LLIDAGPRTHRFDSGSARVGTIFLRHGARRLEVLVLTHPHLDHVGGASAVTRIFSPRLLLDPDSMEFQDTLVQGHTAVRRWLRARPGLRVNFDQLELEVLHPDQAALAAADANDFSVVIRLGYGRFSALFMGDAPIRVEEGLAQRYGGRLDVDLLKVGHHGSYGSTSPAWLELTTPTVALISAGRGNRYQHPSPQVIERLAAAGVRTLRTDRLGTISLRAFNDGRIVSMNYPW
jgi:competence protein ComEC